MKWLSAICLFSVLLTGCMMPPLFPSPPVENPDDQSAIKKCQQYNLALRNRVRELENTISSLQNPINVPGAGVNTLEEKKAGLQRQIIQLQVEITKLEARKNELLAEIGKSQNPGNVCVSLPGSQKNEREYQLMKVQLDESEGESKRFKIICQPPFATNEIQEICEGDTRQPSPPTNARTVNCGDHNLNFVKIVPKSPSVNITLTEEQAKNFYQQAQSYSSSPLYPLVFKAVPEGGKGDITKDIDEFWIQSEPLSEGLYKKIIPDGSVNNVSYNDAREVIKTLNGQCFGNYQFALPKEEHFVYLARRIYDPAGKNEPLQKCEALRTLTLTHEGVRQLLGNQWQLTQSHCEQWSSDDNDPSRQCNPQSYVKKGGTTNSKDATECLPEYRAESTPDVREPNTTLRLILIDTGK